MSIEVSCPQCGSLHHVNDRLAGRRVRCPQCDATVEVIAPTVQEQDDIYATDLDNTNVEPATAASGAANGTAAMTFPSNEPVEREGVKNAMPAVKTLPPQRDLDAEDDDDDDLPIKLKPDEGELDMTPMVDVTFLLLIFFMITAAFSLQKSMESPRQQTDAPSTAAKEEEPEELDVVTVQINEMGAFLVLAADWERETPGKQNLILALREARGDENNPVKLAIEVHEMAKLQALVDCMDAGTICDYGEVQVTQVDGFE
jgi:biopolymer transport protein ExbD/transcription elongation factor Elf1